MNAAYPTALLASVVFGAADFCGGIAAKRAPAGAVTFFAWIAGIVVLLAAVPLLPGVTRPSDLAWGAAGGVAGALGAALLYRALAIGPVSVASPIFCIVGLALPVLVGAAFLGERPGVLAVAGLVLTPLSIWFLTRDGGSVAGAPGDPRRVLVPALAAGCVIGFFLVFLSRIEPGANLWPVVTARVTGFAATGAWLLLRREALLPPPGTRKVAAGAGALDSVANTLYVLAVHGGMLSLVAALVTLAPATTVLLARFVLGERWNTMQAVGLVMALGAGVLISLG